MEGWLISTETRNRATRLALGVTIVLTALKFSAAYVSDSVGVMSEGIHSLLDVVSSGMAFFTVRHAIKPADEDHPFGHGKFETISALFESLLLVLAAVLIIVEGVERFQHPTELVHPGYSVAVMTLSLVASYVVYYNNLRAARGSESMALHANAMHFFADIVTSFAVLVGLVCIHLTGLVWIDAVLALIVGIYIIGMTVQQLRVAISELSDVQLPEAEVKRLRELIFESSANFVDIHDLRTRRSGVTRHIDFHMNVCGDSTVENSHRVCDEIESRIMNEYPGASVTIHVEPCSESEIKCRAKCHTAGGD